MGLNGLGVKISGMMSERMILRMVMVISLKIPSLDLVLFVCVEARIPVGRENE